MAISPSALRSDLYNILDSVVETGVPVEIDRKGHRLVITLDEPGSRLDRLAARPDLIVGEPGDLVGVSFDDWRPDDD